MNFRTIRIVSLLSTILGFWYGCSWSSEKKSSENSTIEFWNSGIVPPNWYIRKMTPNDILKDANSRVDEILGDMSKSGNPTEAKAAEVARERYVSNYEAIVKRLDDASLPGDEIWKFRSSKESWDQLLGVEGFVLVRDGTEIMHVLTSVN